MCGNSNPDLHNLAVSGSRYHFVMYGIYACSVQCIHNTTYDVVLIRKLNFLCA